ncbi:hypothetical protein vBPaePP1G_001 [Pseudomonas phage vB_PaeP_P1G]|uniref:Uncharacterized protein n=1 Tax=Pseudomonas phage vB_PaeP_P1G TaxID=3025372 RepID=A0AAF0BTE7_9CAUD|nr:hypothetical protein vBPaePP1G_001 [Pseudomonas phage vB_PaeP_P1G]
MSSPSWLVPGCWSVSPWLTLPLPLPCLGLSWLPLVLLSCLAAPSPARSHLRR